MNVWVFDQVQIFNVGSFLFQLCGCMCIPLRNLPNTVVFEFWLRFFNHISQILCYLVAFTSAAGEPSAAPSGTGDYNNCRDSPLKFLPFPWKPDKIKSCKWVAQKNTEKRCKKGKTYMHCPKACETTETNGCLYGCQDSPFKWIQ